MRSHVFSRPAVDWAFTASSLIFPWGKRRLCNVVIKELWGIAWRKAKRIKEAVVAGNGYMRGNLSGGRSVREHVRRVLTDDVLELLFSFLDEHTSGGEDPTSAVRYMPVCGKKGLFRRLVTSTEIPIQAVSTFKVGIKLFVLARGLKKLIRRRKEHSLCKQCLDMDIFEEQYRRHCARVAKQGVVVDPNLVVTYNECVNQHAEHLANARHRRAVAIGLRRAMLQSSSSCPAFPAELDGDLGAELPQLFEPIIVGDVDSDLHDGNLLDVAFGVHMDAKGDVDLPAFAQNTAGLAPTDRTSVHYYALAELGSMVSSQFVLDKAHGGKAHGGKTSSLHMDLLLLYLRLARGNRRVLIVVLDNVSSNKCSMLVFFASFVVQAGFVRALLYVYLWPSHGKWLADGVFGLLESTVLNTDDGCIDPDDLCYMMDAGRRDGDVDRRSRVVGLAARHEWTAVLDSFFDVSERAPRSHRILKVHAIVVTASDPGSAFFLYDGALTGADDLETPDAKALMERHFRRIINEPRAMAAETPELVVEWKLPARAHAGNFREVLEQNRRAHDDPIAQLGTQDLRVGWRSRGLARKNSRIQQHARSVDPESVDNSFFAVRSFDKERAAPPYYNVSATVDARMQGLAEAAAREQRGKKKARKATASREKARREALGESQAEMQVLDAESQVESDVGSQIVVVVPRPARSRKRSRKAMEQAASEAEQSEELPVESTSENEEVFGRALAPLAAQTRQGRPPLCREEIFAQVTEDPFHAKPGSPGEAFQALLAASEEALVRD